MKKLTAVFCATMALAMGVTGFAACNKENEEGKNPDRKTVMNVSLNPEVEFVLDGNDKVVTVNALNEEGNLMRNEKTASYVVLSSSGCNVSKKEKLRDA